MDGYEKNLIFEDKEFIHSKLSDCLLNSDSKNKAKINALNQIANKEKVNLLKDTKEHYVIETSCDFKTRKLLAAGDSPFISVKYPIWVRKDNPYVITFDAGRKLSNIGIALVSYATTRNPSYIQNLKIDKDTFLKLKDYVLEDDGEISRITLKNVNYNNDRFKQIILSGSQLENSNLFNKLSSSAENIDNISFLTPILKGSGRPLRCKINHWGGLTIYTPDLLEAELSALINMFEGIF